MITNAGSHRALAIPLSTPLPGRSMCMVVYVAASAPLSQVADHMPPAPFSARMLRPPEEGVRAHLSAPHVYALGAHTGCCCGFAYESGGADEAAGRESVRQLADYLGAAVRAAGPVELYACWNGDEAKPVEVRTTVTPADFPADAASFALRERWLATVIAARS